MMEAITCTQRPSEAIRGHQRPSRGHQEANRGNQSPSEPIRAHQSPSEPISGHQWPSVAISGHQSPSEGRLAVPILAEQHNARLRVHRQLGVAEERRVGARVPECDAAQLHTKAVDLASRLESQGSHSAVVSTCMPGRSSGAIDLASRLEIQGSPQRRGEHLHARQVISGNPRTLRLRGSSTSSVAISGNQW